MTLSKPSIEADNARCRHTDSGGRRILHERGYGGDKTIGVVADIERVSPDESCTRPNFQNPGAVEACEIQGNQKRIIFDITTCSLWSGPAVGIVRVEQELARALQQHWPGEFIYSIYDKATRSFYQVESKIATRLISGDAYLRRRDKFRKGTRLWRHPRRAIVIAAHRRHRKAVNNTLNCRILRWVETSLKRPRDDKWIQTSEGTSSEAIAFCDATTGVLALSDKDLLISAGLDWDHKDIDIIWNLKARWGITYIGICYDMIPWKHPEFVVPGYANKLHQYFIELAWSADLILCISQVSRTDFVDFCEESLIPVPKTAVFELGTGIRGKLENCRLPQGLQRRRFVLFVSTIEPRKNHRLLVQLWDYLLRNRMIPDDVKLVFAGRVGWGVGDLLGEIVANRVLRDRIVLLQNVSDDELASLYEASRFTVMPSFYEGYGLPVIESLALGRLCVTSGRGALGELGGDLVERIDPLDFFAWAERLASLICEEDELGAFEAAISSSYDPPKWDRAAKQFSTAIKEYVS